MQPLTTIHVLCLKSASRTALVTTCGVRSAVHKHQARVQLAAMCGLLRQAGDGSDLSEIGRGPLIRGGNDLCGTSVAELNLAVK